MALWKIIALFCIVLTIAEAKSPHKKREAKSHLCDPVYNNTNKIQCYCTKDTKDSTKFRSADCYPTVEGIKIDDENWKSFEELKDVTNLAFTNSRGITLKFIPKEIFKQTAELVKLEVKYGNIVTIEPFAFANLTSMKEMILSDNQIKILKTNAFAHHANVEKISLDMNMIVEINRDIFIDLPSLEKLYLTSNKITTLHDRAFVHLNSLLELEIDRNNIFSLNSETFFGLNKLKKLDLSGNSLEVIGDNTFLPLKNLRSLNLEGNKIQMLDPKAFNGLSTLQSLSLAHNSLADIDNEKVFEGLHSLLLLNLKGNKLKVLKPEVIAPILNNFHSNASSLDVDDNNFPCDCRLDWFILLKNHTQSPHIKLSLENLKCIPDSDVKDKWTKAAEAAEAEKNQELEETPNTDYEYYDDTQLNGKLFYIDMRFLLNCTTKFDLATDNTPTDTIPSFKQNIEVNPKSTNVQTTTYKNVYKTNKIDIDTANDVKKVTKAPIDVGKERKDITTSRLATVSAKPVKNNEYDQHDNMASDEAKPDKIKAHRSIQEDGREAPKYNHNSADKNLCCAILLSITIYLRVIFV